MEKKYELVKSDSICLSYRTTVYRIKALRCIEAHNLYVQPGDLGGYIESEDNLSHDGLCWVSDNAIVCNNALVFEDAVVCDNASILGHSKVYGASIVESNVSISDHAEVHENARVGGDARIYECAEVFGDAFIFGEPSILGYSKIYEDAHVYGCPVIRGHAEICKTATIHGNPTIESIGLIESPSDYAYAKGFGSVNRTTTFYLSQDHKTVLVSCGCFNGTIEEFKNKVKRQYMNSDLGKEYLRLANLMNARFKRVIREK